MKVRPVSLRIRLVVLTLLATVPVMLVAILAPSSMAAHHLRDTAENDLRLAASRVADNVGWWDETVFLALRNMSYNPAIINMDPEQQRPVLRRVMHNYEQFYLVGVSTLDGKNVARGDDEPPKDYHDRLWFQRAAAGDLVARQAVISRTNNLPGMVVATPIRDASGKIVGVAHVGTTLSTLSQQVQTITLGKTGYVFVFDDQNKVVAHPQLGPADELKDVTSFVPAKAIADGTSGSPYSFTDPKGVRWLACHVRANNGWGVIALQEESEVLAESARIKRWSCFAALCATGAVAMLAWAVASWVMKPVRQITSSAVAIAGGKWEGPVSENRRDEIGTLARAFNRMTANLQKGYQKIEETVEQRTEELRRSNTELIAAREAAENASRAKDEFLANMSHELRTPLTSILGYADVLTDPSLPEPTRNAHLSVVRRSARHLIEIINDMLDLSRIEAGMMSIDLSKVDVPRVVEEVISTLHPRATEKGILLTVAYKGTVPRFIQSDATRLQQILINLVGNAIKFTDSGGVSLTIHCDCTPGDTDCKIAFDITDTGIGITPEQAAQLFQRFVRADTSLTRRHGGAGLGLVISRKLARMLGGDVTVKSNPGQGSTFSLTVDAGAVEGELVTSEECAGGTSTSKESPDAVPTSPGARPADTESALQGLRVLIAEDVAVNQALFRMILSKLGADVQVAANGREAVDMVMRSSQNGHALDLVLMDMQMPEMDGYEATQRLRTAGVKIPIIALTAHAREVDREKCMAAGCTDFVSKPIDRSHLVSVVRTHLNMTKPG